MVDGYEPEINTVYQFHGCHWHGYTCLKDRTKRQQKRYKDKCQIDWLIKNNGWDTKYNLVPTWECEEPILKKVWFEKEFMPYPHFVVYDLEAILAPLNEHLTDDLTYLSRHTPRIVAIHELRACIFTLRCLTNVTPTYYFFDFFPTSPDLVRTPPVY